MFSTEPVTVFRGATDSRGNVSKAPVVGADDLPVTVDVAFAWGQPGRSSVGGVSAARGGRRESAEFTPTVYAPKGSVLQARDRIERANGERYAIVGHAMWDQPGGLDVFGQSWVCFEVESQNG